MANDKNTLLVQAANLLPDNTSGEISPSDIRTVESDSITAALNLFEPSAQTVLGAVNFTGGLQANGANISQPQKAVSINNISELPTPVAGVITLLANTVYIQGDNINLGVNRIVMAANTAWTGIESLVVTLTYSGTGDMFTMVNTSNRINKVFLSAPNGRLFNFSSASGQELRVTDMQSSSASFGTFTGSSSILRFTNISPSFSVGGLSFFGSWASVLWEVAGVGVNGGVFFNLGTATFNSILIDKVLMNLAAGTTFISGLAGSANISAGGLGTVLLTRISGTGTILSGVTPEDSLWEFFHNDEIEDTRVDALLTMQGNATATVITTKDTPVLIAGAWTTKAVSQMTGSAGGRTTYTGGKDAKLPVTFSTSIAPVSGTNIKMSVYAAINGVVDPDSKRSGTASSGSPTSITIPWQITFSTGDYIEVFVENNDTTTNILCSSAISRTN